jgi:hypothetical protein
MIVDTNHMIPLTGLQKEVTKVLGEISASEKPFYVLKNNEVNFAMLPAIWLPTAL